MPESCIVILDPSEYMRNGDYYPTRFEAQQDAARWIIADITSNNAESTVGVIAGTSVLVSTTNNIGQLFQAIKSGVRSFTKNFELETSIQVASMALKHRRNKVGSQRIVLFVGSPVFPEEHNFVKLAKSLRKNNVALQIITLGEEPNQDKLEILLTNSAEGSKMLVIPKGSIPSDFLSETAQFATGYGGGGGQQYGVGGGAGDDMLDPSMDPELAMALRVSLEEERTRQQQQSVVAQGGAEAQMDDETAMMQQALALSMQESMNSSNSDHSSRRGSDRLETVDEEDEPINEDENITTSASTTQPRAVPLSIIDVDQVSAEDDAAFLATLSLEQEMEDEETPKQPSPKEQHQKKRESMHRQNSLTVVKEEEEPEEEGEAVQEKDDHNDQLAERREPESLPMVHMEDADHGKENTDVWEDEPAETMTDDEDDEDEDGEQVPQEEAFENEPRSGSFVATSFNQYELESVLLASPPSSSHYAIHTTNGEEEKKEHSDEQRQRPESLLLPPMPAVPPPQPPTENGPSPATLSPVESGESSNWSQLNQALDEYYTGTAPQDQQQQAMLFPSSTSISAIVEREGSQQIRSCWSNLDAAFDEYNSAISQISSYLPGTAGRISPISPPPTSDPNVVSRGAYNKVAGELEEAKKAMSILKGIVQEKDEMIIALREIMGMMHQDKRRLKTKEGSPFDEEPDDTAESDSEKEMTDYLIQEIRKKNRNLESLRQSLARASTLSSQDTSDDGLGSDGGASTASARLSEKRRRKRELEMRRHSAVKQATTSSTAQTASAEREQQEKSNE